MVTQQAAIVGDTRRPGYLTSHIPTTHSYPHSGMSWVGYIGRGRGEGGTGEGGAGERGGMGEGGMGEGGAGERGQGRGGAGERGGKGEGGRGEGAGEREGQGRGGTRSTPHHTCTLCTHTPPAGGPCSEDPCHMTPPCRGPRSPPVRGPLEHIWCHIQHLVLMPSPTFTEHCGCSDTSVSSRVLQKDRQHQPP